MWGLSRKCVEESGRAREWGAEVKGGRDGGEGSGRAGAARGEEGGDEKARGGRRGRSVFECPVHPSASCLHLALYDGAPSPPFFRPSYHPHPSLYPFTTPRPPCFLPSRISPSSAAFPSSLVTVSLTCLFTTLPTCHPRDKSKDSPCGLTRPPLPVTRGTRCAPFGTRARSVTPLSALARGKSMGTGGPAPGDSSGGARVSRPWLSRWRPPAPVPISSPCRVYRHEEVVLKPE